MIVKSKVEIPPAPPVPSYKIVLEFSEEDLEHNPALVAIWHMYNLLEKANESYYPQAGGPGTDMQGWDLLIALAQSDDKELAKTVWLAEGILKNITQYPSTIVLTT
jgi:hypothetical protein